MYDSQRKWILFLPVTKSKYLYPMDVSVRVRGYIRNHTLSMLEEGPKGFRGDYEIS